MIGSLIRDDKTKDEIILNTRTPTTWTMPATLTLWENFFRGWENSRVEEEGREKGRKGDIQRNANYCNPEPFKNPPSLTWDSAHHTRCQTCRGTTHGAGCFEEPGLPSDEGLVS